MRNTGGSGRSKSNKDKGSNKTSQPQTHTSQTVKLEGPPLKTQIQGTAEQIALNNLIHKEIEDVDLQNKISQIIDLTGCSQDRAEIALFDNKNDMDRAVNMVLEGGTDEGEWRESGKKKKKQSQKAESSAPPVENNTESKAEKHNNKDRNDKENRDRDNRDDRDQDRGFRDQSDNYRRPRRNDNRPPRLSRGRGRPDRAGDRPESNEDNERDNDRGDRGFERGRGRGRGGYGGPRRGRGGGGGAGGNFRSSQPRFEKSNQFEKFEKFDNGPQIDTWTNETAVIGEKEPKISNWGDNNEDWNEDIDSWTGSLAETKVFTASATPAPDPPAPVQLDTNVLSTTVNTFDLGVLYQKHTPNDISAEASYINQFNQQATESIKNSIGIGSGSNSTLQNSMSSQTASNVSALVNLQNALKPLQDNMGPSLSGSELTGTNLTGNGLVGTSLGNNLSGTSIPVNSLTGSGLNATSLSGSTLSGNNLTGTGLSGSGLTGSLTGSSMSSVAQSITAPPSVIPTSSVSQNAMLQQRQKPTRSKLPPPSKIPASAVEMPGHMMTALDVQFGNLEFGTDSSPFSFGGNESATSAFSSAASSSTSTINNHVNAQVGQVPLSQTSESMIPSSIMSAGALEQGSPRNSTLYQQSPYSTPTKQNSAEATTKIQSPPEPLQMPGSTSDLKSNQLMSGTTTQVSLPSTKIDSALSSYSSNSSYQPSGYQPHKQSSGYSSSSKPGSYPGGSQYQSSSNQNQTGSGQYSSQYNRQSSGGSQYQSSPNQYQSGSSQYQSPQSGYQSSQASYQSSQSGYQASQSQYPSNQNQFQNFQSSSTFQNQSNYPTNQATPNSLYQNPTTTASYSSQTPQNSLYSQNSSHTGSYSNQSYLNRDHAAGAGSYQGTVTQSSSSPFKDNQSGASSYRESVPSSSKTRENQTDSSGYSRDTQSASSFSDSQSVAYNRDSQSVGNSYPSDMTSSSYKRDTKSASGTYPHDVPSSSDNSSTYNSRDSQTASSSYNSRDGQSFKDSQSASNFRDTQSGSSAYSNQSGSYPSRDSSQSGLGAGASQSPAGFSAKSYRNNAELTTSTLQTSSLPSNKLVDSFSKMTVKESTLDTSSQFDVTPSTTSKSSTSSASLTSITTTVTTPSVANTMVTSSNTTKISTLPTVSGASSKAPPNLPPGVPLMAAQQYIMGQAGTLPFYGLQGLQGLQQPLYANFEDLQYLQQRMPPLAANNVYDMSATAAAAGLPIPQTTMTSNSTQQTVPPVLYSGSAAESTKLNRVEAQSPTAGSIPSTQQSATGQTAAHQQPYIHLNYSYYYPPSLIPGAGFQYPMIPMPQVTNAAHVGTQAASQYQQNKYGSHHVQYGTNKGVYDDLSQQTPDFSKSPYGTSQSQPKANTTVTPGTATSDIQMPGYGKTHAQAFDKQGFHAGTPPPFNLQMAAGQLASGTQAGPLGAPTAPYGAPFVPMMAHQPHSQIMHHPLQDTTSSNRGSQQTGSHTQTKSVTKSYASSSNWGSY